MRTFPRSCSPFSKTADTVEQEGLAGYGDAAVWNQAQSEGRFFITQDLDFSDIRLFLPGQHSGILLLRLKNPSRREIIDRVTEVAGSHDISSWARCFVVLSESKVRVRRPS